ncbi:MAG: transcriptional regulator [Sulfurovum sp. FS08-3]|nr:MAG: transcriptional regulator [Sulfurovum sp. FS08-3]
MTPQERTQIKTKIIEEIAHLHKQIKALEAITQPIAPDCSLGRLTRVEAMNEKAVNDRILDESRLKLKRLESAMHRVDREDFGICIDCEEDIAIGRLMIRPESVRCIACATQFQKGK